MTLMADRRAGAGRSRSVFAVALSLALVLAQGGCHRVPADQAIRETIARMQAAGDRQQLDGVMKPVAADFSGRGDEGMILDRKQLLQLLTILRMREGAVHATLGPITVTVMGSDRATADFTMLVTGGSGLIPHDGQMERVSTGWRRDGGSWELIEAQWTSTESTP